MMHKLLTGLRLEHAKVWLFAPIDLYDCNPTQLEIDDANHLSGDSKIKWNYHVAPCVLVSKDNIIDTVVIDPSLNRDRPLKLKEWLSAIRNSNISKYTFIDSKYYFFYTKFNSTVITGSFYEYESQLNWVTAYDNATMERELAVNDVAIFLKNKLDAGYPDPQNEIKTLLGNVENMTSFFASQQRADNLQGVSIRTLLIKHKNLMRDAFNYYQDRVEYWLRK